MKRRNFLKITMGTLGSAMGIAAAKADVIGPDIILPAPPEPFEPFEPCGAISTLPANHSFEIWNQKLLNKFYSELVDKMVVPKEFMSG